MPRLPVISGRQAVAAFPRAGFEVKRQRASHVIMVKSGFPAILSVPDHRHSACPHSQGRTHDRSIRAVAPAVMKPAVHFHTLVLDGVFTESETDFLRFHPTPPPSDEEVAQLLATICARVRLLERRGLEPQAVEVACGCSRPLRIPG